MQTPPIRFPKNCNKSHLFSETYLISGHSSPVVGLAFIALHFICIGGSHWPSSNAQYLLQCFFPSGFSKEFTI